MAKPTSPGTTRSPRKRALEIGTDSSKFHEDLPYDHAGGAPVEHSGGTYADPTDGGEKPKAGGGNDPSPFSNLR